MMWRTLFGRLVPGHGHPRANVGKRKALLHLEALEERTLLSGGPVGNLGHLVVFGDSLADTGNVALATKGALPPSAYWQGRFSGGPIWVDTLAKYLGEGAVQPSLAGGLDYAFGGATVAATALPPFNQVPTLGQQVGQYLTGLGLSGNTAHKPAANDLFAVWAGANDFFDTFSAATGPISPIASADTLENSLKTLADAGGRQFVVNNLPPLGQTPFIRDLKVPGLSAAANAWTAAFNSELKKDLGDLRSYKHGMTVVGVDVAGLFHEATGPGNPFGFVNTTDPVGDYLAPGTSVLIKDVTAKDPKNYLFFDGAHPTSKTHQIIGLRAAADVYTALHVHDLVVTSTADTVDPTAAGLSLREMVDLANAMPSSQTITFALGAGGHEIRLSGKDLDLVQDAEIRGPSNGKLTISGEGKSRIFDVGAKAHVRISRLTLIDGAADRGGAIANAGSLQVEDSTLRNNTARLGGAIFNTGVLKVRDSRLSDNTAAGGPLAAGGAIASSGPNADASLWGTVVLDNGAHGGPLAEGGGIANLDGARLRVESSAIVGNLAEGAEARGGGIFNGGTLNLISSILIANMAEGDGGAGLGGGLYRGRGSKTAVNSAFIVGNLASTAGQDVFVA
jgi:outer membrane lipase/esterase